jgi:hypothetical protein
MRSAFPCRYPGADPLVQYAGRLHRLHAAKREVIICDYVDQDEPMLAKMADKRRAGYSALRYRVTEPEDLISVEPPRA